MATSAPVKDNGHGESEVTNNNTTHIDVYQTASLFMGENNLIEIRIPNTDQGVISGYFDDPGKLAAAVGQLDGTVPAIYATLNPVNPNLPTDLNITTNELVPYAGRTTSSKNIVKRRRLLIDCDPVRPSGTSSTNLEHQKALDRAYAIKGYLVKELGWADPIVADSGNGGHVICTIDLPNDSTSTTLIEKCLSALAYRFNDFDVKVDRTTANASRICKVYGTMACKGENTPDRPHRRSKLLEMPKETVVTLKQLQDLASLAPIIPETPVPHELFSNGLDLDSWLERYRVPVQAKRPWDADASIYVLKNCPWNIEHTNQSAYIIRFANGGIYAGCHHESCRTGENRWHELRDLYEPRLRENSTESKHNNGDKTPYQIKPIRIDAAKLVKEHPPVNLESLLLLGVPDYIIKRCSHILSGYPKTGKTYLVSHCVREWIGKGTRVLWLTEETQYVWQQRLILFPELQEGMLTLILGLGADPKLLLESVKEVAGEYEVIIV